MPECFTCHRTDFKDYGAVADHVIAESSTHGASLKWAMNYRLKHVLFKSSDENKDRIPLNEQEQQNKIDAQRLLSGNSEVVTVRCPICATNYRQRVETEYIESSTAWRSKSLTLMITCDSCNDNNGRNFRRY